MDQSEPDIGELQQDYDAHPAPFSVPVKHDGPVSTHELPTRTADSRWLNVTATETTQVAGAELARKYLWVTCTQAVYIGHDKRLVDMGEAGQLPAGVLLPLPTAAPVYARAVTAAGVLSYWRGNWAD